MAGEDFDLGGAGDVWEVDGAATADAGGGGFVGGDRRQVREKLAGVEEERGQVVMCWRGERRAGSPAPHGLRGAGNNWFLTRPARTGSE